VVGAALAESGGLDLTLLELEPHFLKRHDDRSWSRIESIDDADGLLFLCPVCFLKNHGSVGTHSIICWQPHVPQTTKPVPGRWTFKGTSLQDLSLVAKSSSIALQGGCQAHFFIQKGQIVGC
jgi:hypothetical protein